MAFRLATNLAVLLALPWASCTTVAPPSEPTAAVAPPAPAESTAPADPAVHVYASVGGVDLNGSTLPRESRGLIAIPVSANSPCRVVPPAVPMVRPDAENNPACLYPAYRETLPGGRSYIVLDQVDNPRADDFGPVRVPAGHVFMMGDNRDDSLDSRFSPAEMGVGLVPVDNLVGRALVTYWSTDGSASYVKPWTWFSALRGKRIGTTFGGNAP